MNQKSFHLQLQKYGYTFVWINYVEALLELLLFHEGGLKNIEVKLRKKLLANNTLERNYNLSKEMLSKKIRKDIETLIGYRQKLAHKTLIQVETDNELILGSKGETGVIPYDENFFDDAISLARKIYEELNPIVFKRRLT